MRTDPLTTRVAHTCRDLIPSGSRVLVAVSGGIDSLALLHLLTQLAPAQGWALAVAHFNHRQDPAIDDLAVTTLESLAASLDWPFVTAAADLPEHSAEGALRAARYAFLGDAARRWGASHVATGHHADDQAETLLLRLLRGAVAGLGGMRQGRPLDREHPHVQLIRPLLAVQRQELLTYCQDQGLSPIEDPSNANLRFRRNVVRRTVLPLLAAHWPGVSPVLARTAQWLQEDDDLLQSLADAILATLPAPPADLPIAPLCAAPGPLRRRVLRAALAARGVSPLDSAALAAVEAVVLGEQAGAPLPGDWQVRRHGGQLSVQPARPAVTAGGPLPLTLQAGEQDLPGWPYRLRIRPATATDPEDAWQIRLPVAGLSETLHWRSWREGDRLETAIGRQKVAEILRQQGLSPQARRAQLVLADDDGVLWVVGIRRSDRLGVPGPGEPAWIVHVTGADRPDS
jgi:tRNA(Ile)-lysidine synthase